MAHLCAESYRRHQRNAPAAESQLVALIQQLQTAGAARVFAATASGENAPSGGVIVLHDGRTAHYWIAGSRPGPAMTVLLGKLLPRLRDEGLEVFDFVGANTPSIAEFKRHFRPRLTPYYHVEKISRLELRLLQCLRNR